MLAYVKVATVVDEYGWMGDSTHIVAMVKIAYVVVKEFKPEYPRESNVVDTGKLLAIRSERGFPICLAMKKLLNKFAWGVSKSHQTCHNHNQSSGIKRLVDLACIFGVPSSHNGTNVSQCSVVQESFVMGFPGL